MLTRYGRQFAGLAAGLLAVGWLAGYLPLVMVGAACATVLAVAAGWMLSRPRLAAEREIRPNRVSVSNPSRRRSPGMVVLEHFGDAVVPVTIPSLSRGGSHTRPYRLPTDRRGVFQVGPLTISRSDPFQLMQVGQQQKTQETLWVHPATHD